MWSTRQDGTSPITHAAHLELVPGLLRLVEIAREDAGLQPVHAVVHLPERGVEVAKAREHGDRPEGLAADDLLIDAARPRAASPRAARRGACRRPAAGRRPRSAAAIQSSSRAASLSEIIGPMKISGSFGSPIRSAAVAVTSRSRRSVVDLLVHEDPLHADAALSGLVEGAEDDALGGVREVGVPVHDHGGVAAQLEHHLLVAGLRLELPADRRRAGEGEQLQALVGREAIGLLARHRQDREGARAAARSRPAPRR